MPSLESRAADSSVGLQATAPIFTVRVQSFVGGLGHAIALTCSQTLQSGAMHGQQVAIMPFHSFFPQILTLSDHNVVFVDVFLALRVHHQRVALDWTVAIRKSFDRRSLDILGCMFHFLI